MQVTSTFVADVFSVDFSIGTDLTIAPAAGGDNFLSVFWDNLIETAHVEDTVDSGDEIEDASTGSDLFADNDAVLDDEIDIFTDDEENFLFNVE